MTEEEIVEMKRMDIVGVLKLTLTMLPDEECVTLERLRNRLAQCIDMLDGQLRALDNVDEFLRLQAIVIGNR